MLNEDTIKILTASWKPSTRKQYTLYIEKWKTYALENKLNPCEPYIANVLDFLTALYKTGLSYSAINTARSSLSCFLNIDGKPVGEHPLVTRFLRGIFNLRPAIPKTKAIWDPETLLHYLKSLSPVKQLNFKDLSRKSVTLLWLLSGQRGQSMKFIDVRNIKITKNRLQISYGDLLKTSRPGFQQQPINLKAYAPDRRICIVTILGEYLKRRQTLAPKICTQLFISTQKPFNPVSTSTISRWVKELMRDAGIDTEMFTPHSIRSASTSAAKRTGTPLNTILAAAGWTRESTFRRYYNKPLCNKDFDVLAKPTTNENNST